MHLALCVLWQQHSAQWKSRRWCGLGRLSVQVVFKCERAVDCV